MSATILSQIAAIEGQVRARMQEIESADIQEFTANQELARKNEQLAKATRMEALSRLEREISGLERRLMELYVAKMTTRKEIRELQELIQNLKLGNAA